MRGAFFVVRVVVDVGYAFLTRYLFSGLNRVETTRIQSHSSKGQSSRERTLSHFPLFYLTYSVRVFGPQPGLLARTVQE